MRFILKLLGMAGLFMVVSHYLPGFVVKSFTAALWAAVAFGLLNAVIRPVLQLISLPVTILTLGLFSFVINAAIMGLTAYLVPGFEIHGFVPALLGWLLVSVGGLVLSMLFKS